MAEDSGQGIDVIEDEMRYELLGVPTVEEQDLDFEVELPLRGLVSTTERGWLLEYEKAGRLRKDDRRLIVSLLRNGRITNVDARKILEVDSTRARARIQRLRDEGLLVQHGTRGRAYYTLGVIGPDRSNERAVTDAAGQRPISNTTVRALTGLDRLDALALLRRLVDERVLVQHGSRRGTPYTRAPGR